MCAPKAGTLPLVKRTWSHSVRGLSRFDVPFALPNLLIVSERIIRIICGGEKMYFEPPVLRNRGARLSGEVCNF